MALLFFFIAGLTRAPMYPFSTSQYPYPMLSPEMTQVAASWWVDTHTHTHTHTHVTFSRMSHRNIFICDREDTATKRNLKITRDCRAADVIAVRFNIAQHYIHDTFRNWLHYNIWRNIISILIKHTFDRAVGSKRYSISRGINAPVEQESFYIPRNVIYHVLC